MDLAIAAGQNDSLIEQLSFSLPAVATYARERRLVQIMPAGANTFAPNGNQVMTFNLTSQDGWLDPSSLRLHFRIHNRAAAADVPAWRAMAEAVVRGYPRDEIIRHHAEFQRLLLDMAAVFWR